MQAISPAMGGVLNSQGGGGGPLSFGFISHTKPLHDAVLTPSVSFPRKSSFLPKCGAKKEFVEVFQVLKLELLNDEVFEWTHDSRQWVEQVMDYNIPRGKLVRGRSVINYYIALKDGENPSDDELFHACVLGWCIEWLQASFLIHDDIMDSSETRRGRLSWHKKPKVGNKAILDGLTLQYQVSRMLKKHFSEKPYYVDLLNLFSEVGYQTVLGEMMDTITSDEEEKDVLKYSFTLNSQEVNALINLRHHHIAKYKTSFYSVYIPVACALILAGEKLENHMDMKDLLLDMGVYFQVLDDYNDCFGDPSVTGKIGTDIETCKCSWLVLKALELCNEEQKKIILEHYGKADPVDVAKVKTVYNEVDIHSALLSYKRETYDKVRSLVESHHSKALKAAWRMCDKALMSDQWA